jgi:sugar phosphate isomerase/epimerase
MKLGISSFTYGWSIGVPGNLPAVPMNEIELIHHANHFGMSCLQIGDNLPVHKMSPEQRDNLKSEATKYNIKLEIGARKLTEEHLNHYLDLTKFFKSSLLRFVVDGDGYEPDVPTIIGIIRKALPTLRQNNITLGIENHDRFKAEQLVSIMQAINDRYVGICLDCVNSMGAGEGLEWVLNRLAPFTVNLHVKDFKIERLNHKMGFHVTGTPAGKGMMDVHRIMNKLSSGDRCQSAILEQWMEPENDIEETIKKEQQWAVEGIQYLKQLPYFS